MPSPQSSVMLVKCIAKKGWKRVTKNGQTSMNRFPEFGQTYAVADIPDDDKKHGPFYELREFPPINGSPIYWSQKMFTPVSKT